MSNVVSRETAYCAARRRGIPNHSDVQRVSGAEQLRRWHAARYHKRRLALASLADLEFCGIHFPTMIDEIGGIDGIALFPGYLFVSFDLDIHPWRLILNAPGMLGNGQALLGRSGEIVRPLPHGCVEELQSRAANGEFVKQAPGAAIQFVPGELVRVTDGPWWSHTGICNCSDRERVYLLLSVFNRQVVVPINREYAERAEQS